VRLLGILVVSATLGLLVLWTIGPHTKPGSSSHVTQILAFVAVVGFCIVATHRVWDRRVSHRPRY